jgi:hypothetical protein
LSIFFYFVELHTRTPYFLFFYSFNLETNIYDLQVFPLKNTFKYKSIKK